MTSPSRFWDASFKKVSPNSFRPVPIIAHLTTTCKAGLMEGAQNIHSLRDSKPPLCDSWVFYISYCSFAETIG